MQAEKFAALQSSRSRRDGRRPLPHCIARRVCVHIITERSFFDFHVVETPVYLTCSIAAAVNGTKRHGKKNPTSTCRSSVKIVSECDNCHVRIPNKNIIYCTRFLLCACVRTLGYTAQNRADRDGSVVKRHEPHDRTVFFFVFQTYI